MNEAVEFRVSCQHDLLLHLTRPRDLGALNQTLLNTIETLCPQHSLRLYEYSRTHHSWLSAAGLPDTDTDLQLLLTVRDHRPRIAPAMERRRYRSVYPIQSEREMLAALVVEGDPEQIHEQLLLLLLKLYANQYYILSRTKRDGLTDLLNRQAFDERLQRIYQQGTRHLRRVSEIPVHGWQIAMLDIDHFKQVNDLHGHLCGDDVLVHFAQLMHESFRDYDHLFRYGGEEFTILLKSVDSATAHTVLDRFRQRVADATFSRAGHVTVSIGYAPLNLELPITANINRADQALYSAKKSGRNQVCSHEVMPMH